MPLPQELFLLIESLLIQIQPGELSDDSIQALHTIFQGTFIAALDLIDRACVIRYRTPWGRTTYQVRGSTQPYRVFTSDDLSLKPPEAGVTTPDLPFCSCPAFVQYALLSQTQPMCKHVLAVRLAQRLDKFVDRTQIVEDLIADAFATTST